VPYVAAQALGTRARAERRGEERRGGKATTHESKTKHHQRRNSMRQQPPSEHAHIHATNHQIPEKVPRRKPLNHPTATGIAPDALGPSHGLALLVDPDDPQRERVDQATLHQRHDVHVPVQLRARRQGGVGGGEEPSREERGQVGVDAVVEEEGGEDLVRVEGEGG
jgi:hypothetical protein